MAYAPETILCLALVGYLFGGYDFAMMELEFRRTAVEHQRSVDLVLAESCLTNETLNLKEKDTRHVRP